MGEMLAGKVAVITGAGGGIGRAFALAFAAAGARVVVNDVARTDGGTHAAAEAVVQTIRAAGGTAVANTDSVSDEATADHIVQQAIESFGRVDCIVNNAGIVRDRMFFNMSSDEWRAVIDVHLNGSFYVSRAAAPHFKAQASGTYIHMTSSAGLMGSVGQANYSAAKLAIVGLSKSIALDMARYNVRSNCIAPWAWTAMTSSVPAETAEQKLRVEKLKTMEPAKVAPLAVYLASDLAAQVSGQIFGVRANEIYLFNQIRMLRSLHRADGWTPQSIAQQLMPAFEPSFFPNVSSASFTPWDPV